MAKCPQAGTWNHTGPIAPGFYEVRPCPTAWQIGPGSPYMAPDSRVIYVEAGQEHFDAEKFGGCINDPLWEWRGPIEVPAELPDDR